jgi:heptaprenyl diphosphate synthase
METGEPRFSRRSYLRRIAGKTAMLFGLGLVVGAREAKARDHEIALLARAGYSMGMAFQIIDDILDMTSASGTLGKPVAADLRAAIYTLPAIAAVERDADVQSSIVPPPADADSVQRAIEKITRAGGVREARSAAALYTVRARRAIAALSSESQRSALLNVSNRLLDRDY